MPNASGPWGATYRCRAYAALERRHGGCIGLHCARPCIYPSGPPPTFSESPDMRVTPLTAFVASGLGLAMASAAVAQDAATFYEGKTIDLVVGAPAGSGIDLLARVVATHLEGH